MYMSLFFSNYKVTHVRRNSQFLAWYGKLYHRRDAALTAWRPRLLVGTISLIGALAVNSACMPRFVSTISVVEIRREFNNMFKSYQASLAVDGRHFENFTLRKVSLIQSHYFLIYAQLRGDTPVRDAATVPWEMRAGDCFVREEPGRTISLESRECVYLFVLIIKQ